MNGVVAALPVEARAARALSAAGWSVVTSGMGRANAYAAAARLCDQGMRRLLVWGVAGALDTRLQAGDVVLPEWVLMDDGTCWPVHGQWHADLGAILPATAVTGGMLTVDAAITAPGDKQRLGRATGAASVDMEAAAVARCAHERGLPFAVVRVIVDSADQAIPAAVVQAQDDAYPSLNVARRLATHPREVAQVATLAHNMRRARCRLTELAGRLAADVTATVPD